MKNRSQLITLALLSFLTAGPAFAQEGNSNGGGGGGFCVQDRCITLTQAGLRIPAPPTAGGPRLDPNIVGQSHSMIQSLPLSATFKSALFAALFPNDQAFQIVDVVDSTLLRTAIRDYRALLAAVAPQWSNNNVDIFAVSQTAEQPGGWRDRAVTYILPTFNNLVNPEGRTEAERNEGKAITLIHEGLFRGRHASQLANVLAVEGMILDSSRGVRVNPIELVQGLRRLGFFDYGIRGGNAEYDDVYFATEIIGAVEAQNGRSVDLSSFCVLTGVHSGDCTMSSEQRFLTSSADAPGLRDALRGIKLVIAESHTYEHFSNNPYFQLFAQAVADKCEKMPNRRGLALVSAATPTYGTYFAVVECEKLNTQDFSVRLIRSSQFLP